jgi:hypothetical protein
MTNRNLCGFAVATLLLLGCTPDKTTDETILFGPKRFNVMPFGPGLEQVFVSGTLTGDGVGFPDNTYSIYCRQDSMDCWITDVVQVAPNQIGDLQVPINYAVTRWDADVVVVGSANLYPCRRDTISLQKRTQTVVWVQEAINQTDAQCLKSDTKLYKWTIEDSPGWKKMRESVN